MDFKTEKLRGFRDFLPEDMKIRNYVRKAIEKKFKLYGFDEILTPTVEYTGIFTLKSGEEITERMFAFKDKGNRDVCLKPEQTVSTARFFIENFKNFAMPLKFYYFCPVFRYDEPQHARYREFWHLGVELIGSNTPESDAEVISLAYCGLKQLNLNFELELSNIKVIKGVLNSTNLSRGDKEKILHYIDKHNDEGINEILKRTDNGEILNKVLSFKGKRGNLNDLKNIVRNCPEAIEGIEELENILNFVEMFNNDYVINFNIVRGLDYYTSNVFEIHANDMQICGGGRYDNLIGLFSDKDSKNDKNKGVPAVGFAYGFDRVIEALKAQNLIPKFENNKILITYVSEEFLPYCIKVAGELRERNITADLDIMKRKVKKAMEYANNKYRYVIVVGKKEFEEGRITLRDMESGGQKFLDVGEIEPLC